MITQNLKNIQGYVFTGNADVGTHLTTISNQSEISNTGNENTAILTGMASGSTDIDLTNDGCTSSGLAIAIGTGVTTPTASDYTLATPISVSDVSCVSASNVYSEPSGERYITATFNNNTSNDIAINEVGLILDLYISSYFSYKILLDRQVLSSPVTIPANSEIAVVYTLEF